VTSPPPSGGRERVAATARSSDRPHIRAPACLGGTQGRVKISADLAVASPREETQRPGAQRHGGDPDPFCSDGEVLGSVRDFGVEGVWGTPQTCQIFSRPRRRRRP